MKNPTALVGLLVLGAVAYWVSTQGGDSALARGISPTDDALTHTVKTLVNEIPETITQLRDPESEDRNGLRKFGAAVSKFYTGKDSARDRHKDTINLSIQNDKAELEHMTRWLEQLFVKVSRFDVVEWRIAHDGDWFVTYQGRNGREFPIRVPPWAKFPLAWSIELPLRMFGGVAMRGRGPIGTALDVEDEHYFSDGNPHAPHHLRRTERKLANQELRERFVLAHPDSVTPNSPAQDLRGEEPSFFEGPQSLEFQL